MAWNLGICAVSVILLYGSVEALDANGVKEQPCFNISRTFAATPKFLASLSTIYYPMLSRLELFRLSSDLLRKDAKDIQESDLYYDSCIRWRLTPEGNLIASGFGTERHYNTKTILPLQEKFEIKPAEGEGFSATVHTTLTDNKSFFVATSCNTDGEMTWSVGSKYPTLSQDVRRKVIKHVVSLGFKKEFITGIRYDYCDLDGVAA